VKLQNFIHFISDQQLCQPGERILLAVSGGIDSTVMAHLFHNTGHQFAIAHCNFGLRGKESNDDESFVAGLAQQFQVPFHRREFNTTAIAAAQGISIQMAARQLRYAWFETIRQSYGFDHVATAHHLDDQVETFLINLIRGTGIAGLHGIPVSNGSTIRPMMFAYRTDIEDYAKEHHLIYRTDSSNQETKYLRNKIRHEVIPLLQEINQEFSFGLTDTISKISQFELVGNEALADWRNHALQKNGKEFVVNFSLLSSKSPVEPYAWALLAPFGFNETQITGIVKSFGTKKTSVFLSPSHRLVKQRGQLVISGIEPLYHEKSFYISHFKERKKITRPVKLAMATIRQVNSYTIPVAAEKASIDYNKLVFPLEVRKWKQGDSFYPLGMKKKKKLSDFFIDLKFSLADKEQTWLLCSGNDIIWIIGHRIDHRYRVTPATTCILEIVTRES
jgi:tRNA(Ile)-lysidine synthase